MPDSQPQIQISEWDSRHPRFAELLAFIEGQDQSRWASFTADWHLSTHLPSGAAEGGGRSTAGPVSQPPPQRSQTS